ncbi:MAG: hypothetical protein D8M58_09680 [Calditrichaeota bacterium]|nr:MAG: hypothetical protein DWQ03_09055 [Calditrichota bacterium]MBL1205658.1 hypothetical protein [Calditrichota bacterium]NOG45486.1 hypothetical protein [Calditrichota bacterium]
MIQKFYYNYKDVLKAPRIAIGPQRIYIATLGVGAAHVVYFLFSYLALVMTGFEIENIWSQYGLFPIIFKFSLTQSATFVGWMGIIVTAFIVLLTSTSVSRAVYMYLRDNYFYTSKQAIFFAFKKSKSIISIYLTFLFLILPFIFGAAIMAILGRLSWIGEILNAFATLPYIFAGMVLVFITICFILSFFLGPAIIASSEEDGFGAAVQSMHLTWGQPWRLASYGLLTLALLIVGIVTFMFVLKIGLIIYSILFMPLMHSLAPILNNALYYVEVSIGGLDMIIRDLIGSGGAKVLYLKQHYVPVELTTSKSIASSIVYFFLMVAGYMTIGYGQAIVNSALTMSYVIFEMKLTGKSLLKRQDSELAEDKEAFEFNTEANTKNLADSESGDK